MSFAARIQLNSGTTRIGSINRRRRVLERVDIELSRGNFKSALSLVKQLQRKPGGLCAFGSVKLVPKKLSLDKLKLNETDSLSLRSLADSVMDSIQKCIEFSLQDEILPRASDSEFCLDDKADDSSCEDDHNMYIQHEAGHFLVAYLLGVLPRSYRVPSLESLRLGKPVEARVEFIGFEFLKEVVLVEKLKKDGVYDNSDQRVQTDGISSKTLNNFSCTILGGLVTEHMLFGYADGLHSDVEKFDSVLRWVGYTEKEAASHVRWATINTLVILHKHNEARSRLAEAMALGRSVGSCIDILEDTIVTKCL